MTVASTIIEQLGGNQFIAMTGAKQFVDTGNGLQFGLPSRFANRGINKVQIQLAADDTYITKFWKISGTKFRLIENIGGVYAGSLREIFERTTGLDVSL